MGLEEKLPSGVLLTTVEAVAGYARKGSLWPATFGLACCAIEMMATGAPRYDLARFGMEVFRASPRQADLMIVAGRVSQKMAPVLRQIYDQMPNPKWVLAMGVCSSSGGMFNNYAIVQGVDHVVPVDMYLPGCPPRPEMLIDAILKIHDQIQHTKLGANREREVVELETAAMTAVPSEQMKGLMRVTENSEVVPAGTETLEVLATGQGAFGAEGTPDVSGYGGLARTVHAAAAATRPYGGWYDQVVDTLAEQLGSDFGPAVSKVVIQHDQLTLEVEREHLLSVMRHLRDHPDLRFEMCMGASGVHWPEDTGRELHIHYPMLSMTHNRRLSVEVTCPDDDPHVPSIVEIYPGNNWHERETYDFFGVIFDGHPGLTRIEMPDDWVGHPQRKDYPLGGIPVEYKGATIPPPDTRREYK